MKRRNFLWCFLLPFIPKAEISYGAEIPYLTGVERIPGNLIWHSEMLRAINGPPRNFRFSEYKYEADLLFQAVD